MKFPKIDKTTLKHVGNKVKAASPTILTAISVGGVVASVVLTAIAAPKAKEAIEEGKKQEDMTDVSKAEEVAIAIKYGWKPFIPVVATAAGTIACILGSNVLNKKQQAALISAYIALEQQYKDYRKKVIDIHGEEEDKRILKEITKDRVLMMDTPPLNPNDEIVTFYEKHLNQYFEATFADVLFALNDINRMMQEHNYITFNDFLDSVPSVRRVPEGYDLGWSVSYFYQNCRCPHIDFSINEIALDTNLYSADKDMKIYEIKFEFGSEPTYEALNCWDERPMEIY